MIHEHHRKRRSQGGDDSPTNVIRIPDDLHEWIHANPAKAYELGLLVKSHDDPSAVTVTIPEEFVRIKKPRQKPEKARPKKIKSIRAPVDAGENGIEVLETLIQACREKYAPILNWDDDVGDYYVLCAVLSKDLQTPTTRETP